MDSMIRNRRLKSDASDSRHNFLVKMDDVESDAPRNDMRDQTRKNLQKINEYP